MILPPNSIDIALFVTTCSIERQIPYIEILMKMIIHYRMISNVLKHFDNMIVSRMYTRADIMFISIETVLYILGEHTPYIHPGGYRPYIHTG